MEKTKYFKRTPEEMLGLLTKEENEAILKVNKVAEDIRVGFANKQMTILEVDAEYDGIDNLKKGNEILANAGFSTDLETMLQKA